MDTPLHSSQELLMYRSPMEVDNQVYIFNSPIDYKDQHLIVYQNSGMLNGDNGFCVVYKRDHFIISNPPNYQSPTKRSFLNECIRQLYLMNGLAQMLHWDPNTPLENRAELWEQVDNYLKPEPMSPMDASLERVKRQLFRHDKVSRKNHNPVRGNPWGTLYCHFKPIRQKLERRQIRRNYFRPARRSAVQQLVYEQVKLEITRTPAVCQSMINAAENILSANASVIADLNNYHLADEHDRPAVQMRITAARLAAQKHQNILEESVRSMFYAKELFRLMETHGAVVYNEDGTLGSS